MTAEEISANISAMEVREGNLLFGQEIEENFRLYIRVDVQGQRHLTLFFNEIAVPGMLNGSLSLLQFFLENPKEPLLKSTIQEALNLADFDRNLSNLRKGLRDNPADPRFIDTLTHSTGYKFMLNVVRKGDVGVEAFPRWRQSIFFALLNKVNRGQGEEDLRIVTVAFSCGARDLGLDVLLKRGARIRIVMMDPTNADILEFRHGLRQDSMTGPQGKDQIIEQILGLHSIAKRAERDGAEGRLELVVSRSMPSGFVAHTDKGAVTGMFLAQASYVEGPMIEAQHHTEPWDKLYDDWFIRWETGTPMDLYEVTDGFFGNPQAGLAFKASAERKPR